MQNEFFIPVSDLMDRRQDFKNCHLICNEIIACGTKFVDDILKVCGSTVTNFYKIRKRFSRGRSYGSSTSLYT